MKRVGSALFISFALLNVANVAQAGAQLFSPAFGEPLILAAAPKRGLDIPGEEPPASTYPVDSGAASSPSRPPGAASNAPASNAVPANQWDLYNQVDAVQGEIQKLRGLIEDQRYQIDQLKAKVSELEAKVSAGPAPSQAKPADAPSSSETPSTAADLSLNAGLSPDQEKEEYAKATSFMQKRQYDKAISTLEALLKSTPNGQYTANSHYWLGEGYLALSKPNLESAKKNFETVISKFSDSPKVPGSLFKLGKVYDMMGQPDKAKQYLGKAAKNYPNDPAGKAAADYLKTLK